MFDAVANPVISLINSLLGPLLGIVGAAGGLLGLAAMLIMPDFPVADPLSALAVGIVSGLASTGAHQLKKQLGDPTCE